MCRRAGRPLPHAWPLGRLEGTWISSEHLSLSLTLSLSHSPSFSFIPLCLPLFLSLSLTLFLTHPLSLSFLSVSLSFTLSHSPSFSFLSQFRSYIWIYLKLVISSISFTLSQCDTVFVSMVLLSESSYQFCLTFFLFALIIFTFNLSSFHHLPTVRLPLSNCQNKWQKLQFSVCSHLSLSPPVSLLDINTLLL